MRYYLRLRHYLNVCLCVNTSSENVSNYTVYSNDDDNFVYPGKPHQYQWALHLLLPKQFNCQVPILNLCDE